MSAQILDNLDTLAHRGAEMLETHAQVALVDIIRTHAVAHQLVHQFLHHMHTVVHTTQQHGLVAQRNACIGQFGHGGLSLGGHLVGVVKMGVQPHGVVLLQHVAQVVGDTLRADHRGTAADTHNLDMRDGAQTRDDIFQLLVAHHQGIATAEEHISHLGCPLDILQALLDTVLGRLVILLPCKTTAGAMAAVHGAHVGDKKQHTVRITVGKTGSGRILVLMQRVVQVRGGDITLGTLRDALTADRIVRIIGVD